MIQGTHKDKALVLSKLDHTFTSNTEIAALISSGRPFTCSLRRRTQKVSEDGEYKSIKEGKQHIRSALTQHNWGKSKTTTEFITERAKR